LKALEIDDVGEVEIAIYNKDILEKLKTKEANEDLTELRKDRVESTVQEVILTFYRHNVRIDDIDHIFDLVASSVNHATERHDRGTYGNHKTKRSIHQIKETLFG